MKFLGCMGKYNAYFFFIFALGKMFSKKLNYTFPQIKHPILYKRLDRNNIVKT